MAAPSYGFAVGNIRARENKLLKQSDISALITCGDAQKAENILREKGWTEIGGMSVTESRLFDLWKYIFSVLPGSNILYPFLLENDCHNTKVIIKGSVKGIEYGDLLITPSAFDIDLIKSAVVGDKLSSLPKAIADGISDACSVMVKTGDSQLVDGIIEKAFGIEQTNAAKESENSLVSEIVDTLSAQKNMKIALRSARFFKNADFLDSTLIPQGDFSYRLKGAALSGEKQVLECMKIYDRYGSKKAAELYEKSTTELEVFFDNNITDLVRKGKYVTIGPEPIIGYFFAVRTEVKIAEIIISGLACGQSADEIENRMREIYG